MSEKAMADLYDVGVEAFNEAYRNANTSDLQETRRIGRMAEVAAVRRAVIEECAKAILERRWSANPTRPFEFENERALASFVFGLEEARNTILALAEPLS